MPESGTEQSVAGRGEDVVEGLDEEIGVFALEDEGWPDLQHISGRAGRADQYPPFAHCPSDLARAPGCGCTGLLVDELGAEQETFAPDVPDERVMLRECHEALPEVSADLR